MSTSEVNVSSLHSPHCALWLAVLIVQVKFPFSAAYLLTVSAGSLSVSTDAKWWVTASLGTAYQTSYDITLYQHTCMPCADGMCA